MQIDWLTFGAQIVNFLVLTWLLTRFLYRPVVNAMQEREKKIAARMEEAEASRREAELQAEEFRRRSAELDHAREDLLAEAGQQVEAWKQEHQQKVRQEVEESRAEWYRAINREREVFLRDLRRRAGEFVYQTARQVLEQLSVPELEQRIVESFLQKLSQTDDSESMGQALAGKLQRESDRQVIVRSAFDLPDKARQQITTVVGQWLNDGDVPIDFDVDPEVICGIELRGCGHRLAWSVGATLETLEEDFERALDRAIPQGPADATT